MADFKVGGKVICLHTMQGVSKLGKKIEYKKNSVYTVGAIKKCHCDHVALWLGDIIDGGQINTCSCGDCNATLGTDGKVYADSRYFLPLDDFKEVTFKEIKEEVPVSAQ